MSATHEDGRDEGLTRRGFLQVSGLAGAIAGLSATVARAEGQIGYFATDLSDDRLTQMYRTILRIRWHERTMADRMLSDPAYRAYNHFYAGQEAVAAGVCAAAPVMAARLASARPEMARAQIPQPAARRRSARTR